MKNESYPTGPTQPITEIGEAVRFLKRLSASLEKHFSTTSGLVRDTTIVVRRAQERITLLERENEALKAKLEKS